MSRKRTERKFTKSTTSRKTSRKTVIADRRLRVPTTYAEEFEILGEAGILDVPTRDAMVRVARFRNILVHEYARIDPALVLNVLQHHLQDLTGFLQAILRLA